MFSGIQENITEKNRKRMKKNEKEYNRKERKMSEPKLIEKL